MLIISSKSNVITEINSVIRNDRRNMLKDKVCDSDMRTP
jgi:hypothetical protein